MALSINMEDHYSYTLVELAGKVDSSTAELLDRTLETAIVEGHRDLILDCKQLLAINSQGLRILLRALKGYSVFYSLTLCNVSNPIRALLDLTGISRFTVIRDNLDQAAASIPDSHF
ncbi:STAS domain-containing protein [Endozoicomonas sp. OPT23]|uniref:STAS domain-containing protein n=1 Tax=Endozoicomonas sp. OPT23 TaxID=2072845 RepID=UPI001891CFB0|nr:STAS domain-containing protein [Endozoicomonas sp. OPT23]